MFLNAPTNPTPLKHVVYLFITTLLGITLGIIVHIIVETLYLSWAVHARHDIVWHWSCALHPVIQIGLPVLGAVAGLAMGRFWWQWVYVDRRWAKGINNTNPPKS
ncbi:MAG: hypothetical protein WC544_02160 [Patescibacteria group bacterium]